MQNVLLPVVAVLLFGLFWFRGKSVKPMLRSTDASGVAELNRAQLTRVLDASPESADVALVDAEMQGLGSSALESWQPPATERERLELFVRLRQAMGGGPDERLEAVKIASIMGGQAVLPLLRRALRDSDARVVEAAAAAIAPQRGAPRLRSQASRPPRNVARMR